MVKVSVIIPVYNVQDYLEECLESVLSQTLQDMEIICVDDGSLDNSGRILDRYAMENEKIRVIHKANTGYGHTMNLGLGCASGEYIGIVESDDFIDKDMYLDLYHLAEKHKADFVKTNYWKYQNREKQLFYGIYGCKSGQVLSRYDNPSKILSSKSIWAGLYRREFLERNHIRFLETPGASYQDTSFWFKVCIMAERGYFSEKPYVYYRTDNSGSSVKSAGKVYYICDEMGECLRYMAESGLDLERIYPYYVMNKKNVYLWNLKRILPEYRPGFMKRMHEELQADMESRYMGDLDRIDWDRTGVEDWMIDEIRYVLEYPEDFLRYISQEYILLTMDKLEEFLTGLEEGDVIYIYGAGKIGRRLSGYIGLRKPSCIIQYVVTGRNGDTADTMEEISSPGLDTAGKIIVSVGDLNARRDMTIRAMGRGFDPVYVLADDTMRCLKEYEEKTMNKR